MLIGYMRVSTGEQNLDLQRDALDRAGCNRIFDDVCSGRTTERPGLDKAIDIMRDGDALVVWKLDRIGRSLPHVVGLVGDLQKRGVGLKVLTGDIDTTTVTGRLVFGIFATLAEFERDLIHERTMAGLAAAIARCSSILAFIWPFLRVAMSRQIIEQACTGGGLSNGVREKSCQANPRAARPQKQRLMRPASRHRSGARRSRCTYPWF